MGEPYLLKNKECLAEIKLLYVFLVYYSTGEAVAMKVIDLKKHANAAETVRKEVCVHRMLNDPHVIRFYGRRENGNFEFIFLEYASGGELFDRIGNIFLLMGTIIIFTQTFYCHFRA